MYSLSPKNEIPEVIQGSYPHNECVSMRYSAMSPVNLFVFPLRIPEGSMTSKAVHVPLQTLIEQDMTCWQYFMSKFTCNVNGDSLPAISADFDVYWEVNFTRARNSKGKRSKYEDSPPVYIVYCLVAENHNGDWFIVSSYVHGIEMVSKDYLLEKRSQWEDHYVFGEVGFDVNVFPINLFMQRRGSFLGKQMTMAPVLLRVYPDSITTQTACVVTVFGEDLMYVLNIYFGQYKCEIGLRENNHIWIAPPVYHIPAIVEIYVEHSGNFYNTGLYFQYTAQVNMAQPELDSVNEYGQLNIVDDSISHSQNSVFPDSLFEDQSFQSYTSYRTDLHWNVMYDTLDKITECIESNPHMLNAQDIHGCTPLFLAIYHQKVEVVIHLLEHDADYSISTWDGISPLHIAAYTRNSSLLRILFNCYDVCYYKDVYKWDCSTFPNDVFNRDIFDYYQLKNTHSWVNRIVTTNDQKYHTCLSCDNAFNISDKEQWCKICRRFKHTFCDANILCPGFDSNYLKHREKLDLSDFYAISVSDDEDFVQKMEDEFFKIDFEEPQEFVTNVLNTIELTEKKLHENYNINSPIAMRLDPIFTELKNIDTLNRADHVNVFIMGPRQSGKSSLINSMTRLNISTQNDNSAVRVVKYEAADNVIRFYECEGSGIDLRKLKSVVKEQMNDNIPDVIILCLTRNDLMNNKCSKLVKAVKSILHDVRTFFLYDPKVIINITQCDVGSDTPLEELIVGDVLEKEMARFFKSCEHYEDVISIAKAPLIISTITLTYENSAGTNKLKNLLQGIKDRDEKAQRMDNNDLIEFTRRKMASAIVGKFSQFIKEITDPSDPLTSISTEAMLRILASFSADPYQNYDTYIDSNNLLVSASKNTPARGKSILGMLLNRSFMSNINWRRGGITTGLGWHAYNYFCT